MNHTNPDRVAVIGAGPVGLAAAAHLLARGIEPIFFEAIGYDPQSARYVDLNACKTATPISGTAIRRALMAGEALPNWMMRSEVQDVVRAELMMKHAVFQD